MDKRWKYLGDLLVNYSANIKQDERVMIAMVELETYPLICAVYEACTKAGAYPQVQFLSEKLNRLLLKNGNEQQIEWLPEIEAYGMEWADVYFGLRGAHNPHELWNVPAETLAKLRHSMGKVSALRWEKTRWCLVRVPNVTLAQQAGLDEETVTEMFFNACLLDWPRLSQKWGRWAGILGRGKVIRVVGQGTDVTFSVAGRTWDVDDGRINMPGGEIATAPVVHTVDGCIYFDSPGVLGGRFMHDIRLCWQQGTLVEATASTNQDFLQAIVNTDPGASLIGEFAIGTNPELRYFCNDILLDEKIAGTVHIALGRAYPKVGGTNQSAIHWDIVKDLRREGAIYLDGKLIFESGRVLF